MVFHGHIKAGTVILDEPVNLPDGMRVTVLPESGQTTEHGPTLADVLGDLIGKAEGLPPDFAENHDHYIHGAPKNGPVQ